MSKEHHDERAARGRVEQPDKTWITECLRLLKPHVAPGSRVLDIGCGNGETADLLRAEMGCQMTCLDYAPSHLARVQAKGHETICCNLDREEEVRQVEDQRRGQYDAVTSLEVVEHMFEPDTLFRLAHAVLKPGGVFVVSTPNMAYVGYRLYSMWRGNLPPSQGHHISFFNARRLWQQMVICGFDVEKMEHFGAGEFYLDRAMGRHGGLFRRGWIRALFWAGLHAGGASLRHSGLIGMGRKSAVQPLGLSGAVREDAYARMPVPDRREALARIMPLLPAGKFDEHPDFMRFCEEEWRKLENKEG